MYAPIFGLENSPFGATDNLPFEFSAGHKEKLTRLLFSLQGGHGVVELVVEGRTPTQPITQFLADQMPDNCLCAVVLNPRLSHLGFLHALCQQLNVPLPSKEYADASLIHLIVDALSDSVAAGQTNVLIVNDAHLAPVPVTQHIAQFATPTPQGTSLLQVVLVGHSPLHKHLKQPDHAALAATVVASHVLGAPTEGDTQRHIQRRMEKAGWQGPLPFEAAATKRIHAASFGMPERIDAICDKALRLAQAKKRKIVTLSLVEKALSQVPPAQPLPIDLPSAVALPPAKVPRLGGAPAPKSPSAPKVQAQALPTAPSRFASLPRWVWVAGGAMVVGALIVARLLATPGDTGVHAATAPQEPQREASTAAAAKTLTADQTQPNAKVSDGAPAAKPMAAIATPAETIEPPAEPSAPPATTAENAVGSAASPDLSTLKDDRQDTWPAIGKVWGLKLSGESACADALEQGHQCFRSTSLKLADLKSLNRPGLVRITAGGVSRWVQLLAMDANTVTLASGPHRWVVSLKRFDALWNGAFSTLWRRPPGLDARLYAANISDPAGQWLDEQLQALQTGGRINTRETTPQARLEAFQKHQGLPGEGKALPSTFIRVNQLIGAPEPKLLR